MTSLKEQNGEVMTSLKGQNGEVMMTSLKDEQNDVIKRRAEWRGKMTSLKDKQNGEIK